jgi:hypothetical protein
MLVLLASALAFSHAFVLPRAPVASVMARVGVHRMTDTADAGWSDEEAAALEAAIAKPIGKLFGGQGQGDSYLKLKSAATGGPIAASTWDEVRAEHAALAQRSDDELSAAFLALDRTIIDAGSASAASNAGKGGANVVAAACAVAIAVASQVAGGGGADGDIVDAQCATVACKQRTARLRGEMGTVTPLARYQEQLRANSDAFAAQYRPVPERKPIDTPLTRDLARRFGMD